MPDSPLPRLNVVGRASVSGRQDFTGAVSYAPVSVDSAPDVYIDWEKGNRQVLALTSDVNVYLVHPYNGTFHLLVEQRGNWKITWKVNDTDLPVVAWAGGAAIDVTTGGTESAPIYDVFSFSYWEGRNIYMAMATQGMMAPTS
jgi:hypothetical protein